MPLYTYNPDLSDDQNRAAESRLHEWRGGGPAMAVPTRWNADGSPDFSEGVAFWCYGTGAVKPEGLGQELQEPYSPGVEDRVSDTVARAAKYAHYANIELYWRLRRHKATAEFRGLVTDQWPGGGAYPWPAERQTPEQRAHVARVEAEIKRCAAAHERARAALDALAVRPARRPEPELTSVEKANLLREVAGHGGAATIEG